MGVVWEPARPEISYLCIHKRQRSFPVFSYRILGDLSKIVNGQRSYSVSLTIFFTAVGASQPWSFLLAESIKYQGHGPQPQQRWLILLNECDKVNSIVMIFNAGGCEISGL